MSFEWKVNIGTVIHLVGLVITVMILYSKIASRMIAMETKIDAMWKWWLKNGNDERK